MITFQPLLSKRFNMRFINLLIKLIQKMEKGIKIAIKEFDKCRLHFFYGQHKVRNH